MGFHFEVVKDPLQAGVTKTGNGTGAGRLNTKTSRAVEFFVNVTATSGTVAIVFESSIDETNYAEQDRISITGTGVVTTQVNRADHALGTVMRVRWEVSGGSVTFDVNSGRME